MPPRILSGPRGGKYVLSAKGEKLYVPLNAAGWTREGVRWRLRLKDGRNMLYPQLA